MITFGPDGYTGHPDHQAVSRWTDLAVARAGSRPRVLHAVSREDVADRELDEDFGVFELGRPRVCADDDLAVLLALDGTLLERKVEALLHQVSQTAVSWRRSAWNGSGRGSQWRASPSPNVQLRRLSRAGGSA